mmetsp:Transcript_25723/g.72863  ORF Transcript_25723/g.72863 Transcript_25723/m.72863 type:complete len:260 (-) Transcript_25723:1243-2022(-)
MILPRKSRRSRPARRTQRRQLLAWSGLTTARTSRPRARHVLRFRAVLRRFPAHRWSAQAVWSAAWSSLSIWTHWMTTMMMTRRTRTRTRMKTSSRRTRNDLQPSTVHESEEAFRVRHRMLLLTVKRRQPRTTRAGPLAAARTRTSCPLRTVMLVEAFSRSARRFTSCLQAQARTTNLLPRPQGQPGRGNTIPMTATNLTVSAMALKLRSWKNSTLAQPARASRRFRPLHRLHHRDPGWTPASRSAGIDTVLATAIPRGA